MSPKTFVARDPEGALQLAARLMALVRSGRSYAVQHPSFRTPVQAWHAMLEPLFALGERVRFENRDGDLFVNGDRLPYRAALQRPIEQFAVEIAARTIGGFELTAGLTVDELETFMGLFVAGERWKGSELVAECERQGLTHIRTFLAERPKSDAGIEVLEPADVGTSRGAWTVFLGAVRRLHAGDALDLGVELRHVKRAMQPVIDGLLANEPVLAMLAAIAPGEPDWAHAAHTTLLAVALGIRLGLPRRDLSDLAVAALLHDVGHSAEPESGEPRPHTELGARRIAWATTLNRSSLGAMRVALEHHTALSPEAGEASWLAKIVATADAYVTFLSSAKAPRADLWPSVALARVLARLQAGHEAALAAALVRALGCHPPGQVVELDDGHLAFAVLPGAEDPRRPWVQLVADRRGRLLPGTQKIATLAPERRIVRALPRHDWPIDDPPRFAA